MNFLLVFIANLLINLLLANKIHAQKNKNAFDVKTVVKEDFGSNLSGGIDKKSIYLGNIDLIMTFDTEKGKLWKGGKFFVYGLNNHGISLSSLVGDIQISSNIEAEPNTRLYQFWYQHQIGNLSITVGQHDLNSEFAFTDFGGLFLNSSFGIQPDISTNVPVSIFPIASLGGIIKWNISDQFTLMAAVYDGNPGDEASNPNSIDWKINSEEGFTTIYEIQYNFIKDSLTMGSYKLGIWHHTADFISDHDNKTYQGNQGIYFIANQSLVREHNNHEQGFGFFLQLGTAPKDFNTVKYYVGGGLHYHGLLPKRDNDDIGLAVGHASLCNIIKKRNPLESLTNETVLELTYNAVISPHFSIQPDLQYVINPGGSIILNDAVVGIIRMKIEF